MYLWLGLYAVLFTNVYCQKCKFICDSGQCIITANGEPSPVCDLIKQCSDGSDETSCGVGACARSHYNCTNGHCVAGSLVCDGQDDCGDNSDEMQCASEHSNQADQHYCYILIRGASVVIIVCCVFLLKMCIILGACIGLYHQMKVEEELLSKGVPITSANVLGLGYEEIRVQSTVKAGWSTKYNAQQV